MAKKYMPEKHLPDGQLKSQVSYWKSTSKSGGGPKLKVTLYLTKTERRLMSRLAKQEGLKEEGHTAIVRRALEMAMGKGQN